jgi:hypothetical protein
MWALDATCAWLDTTFRIRCQDEELGEQLGRLLRAMRVESGAKRPHAAYAIRSASGRFELYRGRHPAAPPGAADQILDRLITDLNRTALAAFTGFATHAGVVANRETAVVFPASSGGGKSTLTAACILQGFEYVSDEALCLTFDDARLVPYPRPIGVSSWSRGVLGIGDVSSEREADAYVAAADLRGQVATGELRVGNVVLFELQAGPPDLAPLPRSEVLASLVRLSFNHYKRPRRSFEIASEVASGCRAWKLSCGDPLASAELLRRELVG